ncbi:PaaI family thioesterase [Paenibacillus sediminis]|uniref:Acyl-coenzyme A thioesterase THEM4 n=1 Tax=Paenibacillus sediminis TaxID=664909 RepID=A0ABS4H1I6_9BACL|nr:PaaI family thioesterase [Paenibacillus sediminis]MBP1936341.1 uncharacterized protein (TIGR00369 family) [Paenibacillus sediminis]
MDVIREIVVEGEERFWGLLGCRLISSDEKNVTIGLTTNRTHWNSMGIVHGGVLSSLMDQAMGMLAIKVRDGMPAVTTNLNVHFLAPMEQGELTATARVIHETNRTITLQAEVRDADGVLGSVATGTFRVVKLSN